MTTKLNSIIIFRSLYFHIKNGNIQFLFASKMKLNSVLNRYIFYRLPPSLKYLSFKTVGISSFTSYCCLLPVRFCRVIVYSINLFISLSTYSCVIFLTLIGWVWFSRVLKTFSIFSWIRSYFLLKKIKRWLCHIHSR